MYPIRRQGQATQGCGLRNFGVGVGAGSSELITLFELHWRHKVGIVLRCISPTPAKLCGSTILPFVVYILQPQARNPNFVTNTDRKP